MKWLIFVVLFLAACGFDKPAAHTPDAGSGSGTNTCTFDQSALDQCVLAP